MLRGPARRFPQAAGLGVFKDVEIVGDTELESLDNSCAQVTAAALAFFTGHRAGEGQLTVLDVRAERGWLLADDVTGRCRGMQMSARSVSAKNPTAKIIPRDMRQPLSTRHEALTCGMKSPQGGCSQDFECYLIDGMRCFSADAPLRCEGYHNVKTSCQPGIVVRPARPFHAGVRQEVEAVRAPAQLAVASRHLLLSRRFSSNVIPPTTISIVEGVHHGQHCAGTDQCF